MTFISALKLQAIVDIFHKLNIKNSYKFVSTIHDKINSIGHCYLIKVLYFGRFAPMTYSKICLPQVRTRLQWPFLDCIVLL